MGKTTGVPFTPIEALKEIRRRLYASRLEDLPNETTRLIDIAEGAILLAEKPKVDTSTKERRARLQASINRLAVQPEKVARVPGRCCYCACEILPGQKYRGGATLSAHDDCYQSVARELKGVR